MDMRLYFYPQLAELTQAIGYAGLPVKEVRKRIKDLVAKYGQEKWLTPSPQDQ